MEAVLGEPTSSGGFLEGLPEQWWRQDGDEKITEQLPTIQLADVLVRKVSHTLGSKTVQEFGREICAERLADRLKRVFLARQRDDALDPVFLIEDCA